MSQGTSEGAMRRTTSVVGLCLVSSVCLAADPPSGDKSPDVLVATPQPALVWQAERAPVQVWLVRLTPHDLTFKLSASTKQQKTVKGGTRGILGVQLADGDIFRFRSSKGVFTRYDPLQRSFVNDQGKESGPATLTHEAEGSGTTGDEAIRDALRNAVRAAVGVLVEGETLVKQEDVISDKVLTYSDGFVSSYDVLSREQKDGLFRVRIRAHVERRKLLADLRTAGVSLDAVDGKGLVASALTRKDARESAAGLLNKAFTSLPNLLVAEVQPPTATDYQIDTQRLPLSITVRVDRKKYFEFAEKLDSVASKISLAHTSVILQGNPTVGVGDHFLDWAVGVLDPVIHYGPALPGNPKSWCLWMSRKTDDRHHTLQLACYVLDADITEALASTRGKLNVEVTLLDAQKQVIARELLEPKVGGKRLSYWLGWMNPRPRLLQAGYTDVSAAPLLGTQSLGDLGPAVNAGNTVNAFLIAACLGGLEDKELLYARGVWITPAIKITPEKLNHMKEIRARIVFEPASGSKPQTGDSGADSPQKLKRAQKES
jgi:hypothetical protein